jgi:TolA-binding protein
MRKRCSQSRIAALEGMSVSAEHLKSCEECAAEHEAKQKLAELAVDLPWSPPTPERVQEIRSTLLLSERPHSTERGHSFWRRAAIVAAAAAAFGFVALKSRDVLAPTPKHATIVAGPETRYLREDVGDTRIQRVRLFDGTIRLQVDPLEDDEKMIVATADAEVEVRGTVFDVLASGEELTRVHVISGLVEVRHRDQLPVLLRPGESWTKKAPEPPKPAQEVEVEAQPSVELPVPELRSTKVKVDRETEAQERAFREAWTALSAGNVDRAVELFERAEAIAPRAQLAEDAAYGRAVALERTERRAEAADAMKRFLAHYPRASRSDEVAVALGWLLLKAGDRAEAKLLFERATASPAPSVRQSAERGLTEISSGKQAQQ